MTSSTLELIVQRDGETLRLCSPEAGWFTRAQDAGAALAPGADAGTLLVLGKAHTLLVPEGIYGLVSGKRPERVHEPVGHGSVLYELRPLEGAGITLAAEEAHDEAGLVLRAPQSGRFYQRPSPDQPPFAPVGAELEEGRPVGLIEVMKTFTHVPYRATGGLPARAKVVRWIVAESADVSEGDPLVEVEPA
jgi:acetyl-CoA carboxylase biotin carboxyl carrier protein